MKDAKYKYKLAVRDAIRSYENGVVFSLGFRVTCGVLQGGIVSSFMFNIYVDKLLNRLSKSGYGCHVGNTFFGCIMYADDLILLSPLLCGLQYMIDICSDYATDSSLVFNAKKTVCRPTIVNKPKCFISGVSMDNDEIKFTDHFKYLGVHFTVGSDISVDIVPVRRKFL